ncbi:MAG: hypothetical protein ACKOHG_13025, partial [Planctomycetia bacterium]
MQRADKLSRRFAVWCRAALLTWCCLSGGGGGAAALAAEITPDCNRDVRPILSQHCVACHGPHVHDRGGGLGLVDREA